MVNAYNYAEVDTYNMYSYIIGFRNQLVDVNVDLWEHCMIHRSIEIPSFLPNDICNDLQYIVENSINIRQITHQNCKAVYTFLINELM